MVYLVHFKISNISKIEQNGVVVYIIERRYYIYKTKTVEKKEWNKIEKNRLVVYQHCVWFGCVCVCWNNGIYMNWDYKEGKISTVLKKRKNINQTMYI